MKLRPLIISISISLLLFTVGFAYCQIVKHFGASLIGASGTFVTTVSKQPYQQPSSVYFQAVSKSMTSSAESYLAQTVNSGLQSAAMSGATGGTMQLFYFSSLSLDGTLSFYTNSAGSGNSSGGSVSITAGTPYEWDYLTSGTTAPWALSNTSSVTFAASTTVNGGTTTNTSTSITAVGLYP